MEMNSSTDRNEHFVQISGLGLKFALDVSNDPCKTKNCK